MSLVTRCPLIAPQLMRPAAAGVRIVLKCWVAVFAAHGPTSCFSPTRTGVLADLSRCKPLPGIAVNGALVWRQVTAPISGSTSGALAGPDNKGYRRLGAPDFAPNGAAII